MKNKMKYIISTILVVLLTFFFVKAPDWYYVLTDSGLQSDYGTQQVVISTNIITPQQFFTIMRSGSAVQMQINNMDSNQFKEGLSKSIDNMKNYMDKQGITFAVEVLSYISQMTDEYIEEKVYAFQSVTGIADNELLSTVICVVERKFQEGYVSFIFDCNTNIIYAMNFIVPFEVIKCTDDMWSLLQKSLSLYWNISVEELWCDIYSSEITSMETEEVYMDKTLLYWNINTDITEMIIGMSDLSNGEEIYDVMQK